MAKYDIGVGEEFPAQEPPPHSPEPDRRHRHGRWHFAFRILFKVAVAAAVIGGLFWLAHGFAGPFAWHGPYAMAPYAYYPGWHPGWHGHFFFPFLVVLFLLFAFRRRHHGYGCSMRRWHDEMHRERGERI